MARAALSAILVAAAVAAPPPAACGPVAAAGCVAAAAGEDSALLQLGAGRRAEATLASWAEQSGTGEGWVHCGYPSLAGLTFSFEYTRLFRTEGFDPPEFGDVSPLTVPLAFTAQKAEESGGDDAQGSFVKFQLPSSPGPNARILTFICEFETRERLACVEALSGRFFGHLTFDKEDLREHRCVPTKFDIAAAYGELLLTPFNNQVFVQAIGAITGHGSADAGEPIPIDFPVGAPAKQGHECRRASKWHPGTLVIPCEEGLTCVSWCPSGKGVCAQVPRKCDRLSLEGNYTLSLTTYTISTSEQVVQTSEIGATFFNQLDGQGLASDQGVYVQFATDVALEQLSQTKFALCIQDEPWTVTCVDAKSGTPVWRFAASPRDVDQKTCAPEELEVVLYGAGYNGTAGAFQPSASRGVLRKGSLPTAAPALLSADAGVAKKAGEEALEGARAAAESEGCHLRPEHFVGKTYEWVTHGYTFDPSDPQANNVFPGRLPGVFSIAPEGFLRLDWIVNDAAFSVLTTNAACVFESRDTLLCSTDKANHRFTADQWNVDFKSCAPRAMKEQSWGQLAVNFGDPVTFISAGWLVLSPATSSPPPP